MAKKKTEEELVETASAATEEATVVEETAVVEKVAAEVKAETEEKPKKAAKKKAEEAPVAEVAAKAPAAADAPKTAAKQSKRAERIGIVSSDKMTKTVVVRVDRQVKHPIYRKYIKRRKNFMAHDEFGATVGDKVRIVETRPLSARKRWRVVEIIQKAEK